MPAPSRDARRRTSDLTLEPSDRVLVFSSAAPLQGCPSRIVDAWQRNGLDVALVRSTRGRNHRWLRERRLRPELLVATDDLVDATLAGAEHGVPVINLADIADDSPALPALVQGRLEITTETLLRIQPSQRTSRPALAEVKVEPDDPNGTLRIRQHKDLDAVVPSLRIVNRDPFSVIVGDDRCRHDSPNRVGLCWTDDEPLADRMIHRDARFDISPQHGATGLLIEGDGGRFRAYTEHLVVGPGWKLQVASPTG